MVGSACLPAPVIYLKPFNALQLQTLLSAGRERKNTINPFDLFKGVYLLFFSDLALHGFKICHRKHIKIK